MRRVLVGLLARVGVCVAVLLLLLPVARAQQGAKIVVLGADLREDQRAALLGRFGVDQMQTRIETITTAETQQVMQNIIPMNQGYTAVSSSLLECTGAGSGLRVVAENLTRVTAGMYASALVTAGVSDANVIIAAPQDAPAEGMTALAGLFKGLNSGICGSDTLDPRREALAYRQLAVTADLANALGGQSPDNITRASDFILRCEQILIREKNNPDAAYPIVDGVQNDTGIVLSGEQRQRVAEMLAEQGLANINWGGFANGWALERLSDTEVRAVPNGGVVAPANVPATSPLEGRVTSTNPLRVAVPGATPGQLNAITNAVEVFRNDAPARLSDLRVGDAVTLFVKGNTVQRIVATSAPSGTQRRTVTGLALAVDRSGTLSIATKNGKQDFAVADVPVTRNGNPATLSAIQPDDQVTIRLDANGQPQAIDARSAEGTGLLSRLPRWWPLVFLFLLVPLLFVFFNRRRRRDTVLVESNRRTRIDEDELDDLK